MMDVKIIGLGTANPPLRLPQEEIYQFYINSLSLSDQAKSLLERIFISNRSIAYRHFGMDSLADVHKNSQDELIARFERFGVMIATESAQKALDNAGLSPNDVDALIVNTCTGYLCPGLTSYVAQSLSMKKNIWPFDLMGMGCGGAIPALKTAYNFLSANPDKNVLTISVEVCSATLFFSEAPDVLVTNAIFGDGAAATVLTNRPGKQGIFLKQFSVGLFPEYRSHVRYITQDSKLRNVLSPEVPSLGAKGGKQVIEELLNECEKTYNDIAYWAIHPGGEKVIDALQHATGLPGEVLSPSRSVLRNYGNMSSATVLFVLDEIVRTGNPQAGDFGVLCSFGAGFSAFAALVEF